MKPIYHFWVKNEDDTIHSSDIEIRDDGSDYQKTYQDINNNSLIIIAKDQDPSLMEYAIISPGYETIITAKLSFVLGVGLSKQPTEVIKLLRQAHEEIKENLKSADEASHSDEDGYESENA
jgi:fructose-specific phosphotransferase system component IIB